jgi:hypothetical protein
VAQFAPPRTGFNRRQLIGDDIIPWGTTIFESAQRKKPRHQDGEYYPIRPLRVLTIWIALTT